MGVGIPSPGAVELVVVVASRFCSHVREPRLDPLGRSGWLRLLAAHIFRIIPFETASGSRRGRGRGSGWGFDRDVRGVIHSWCAPLEIRAHSMSFSANARTLGART